MYLSEATLDHTQPIGTRRHGAAIPTVIPRFRSKTGQRVQKASMKSLLPTVSSLHLHQAADQLAGNIYSLRQVKQSFTPAISGISILDKLSKKRKGHIKFHTTDIYLYSLPSRNFPAILKKFSKFYDLIRFLI